jgi:hypothetical protein
MDTQYHPLLLRFNISSPRIGWASRVEIRDSRLPHFTELHKICPVVFHWQISVPQIAFRVFAGDLSPEATSENKRQQMFHHNQQIVALTLF